MIAWRAITLLLGLALTLTLALFVFIFLVLILVVVIVVRIGNWSALTNKLPSRPGIARHHRTIFHISVCGARNTLRPALAARHRRQSGSSGSIVGGGFGLLGSAVACGVGRLSFRSHCVGIPSGN
jgi:hypothetical protein